MLKDLSGQPVREFGQVFNCVVFEQGISEMPKDLFDYSPAGFRELFHKMMKTFLRFNAANSKMNIIVLERPFRGEEE